MQLAVDRRHRRDPETLAAMRELDRVAGLNRRMANLVQKLWETGEYPLLILEALAPEIRHADNCLAALKASKD